MENRVVSEYKKEDFIYTHCYCEENVFKMLEKFLKENKEDQFYAIIISNPRKQVAIWGTQRTRSGCNLGLSRDCFEETNRFETRSVDIRFGFFFRFSNSIRDLSQRFFQNEHQKRIFTIF